MMVSAISRAGKPPSPAQFCCAEPFLPPPLHQPLSHLFQALAAPVVLPRTLVRFPPETPARMPVVR
jgi:hypothetical protein